MIVKQLGRQGAKTLSTPVSDMHHESEELLDHEKFEKYQSLCARANFLAIVRNDLHFGAKECCRSMLRPTVSDWSKLKIIRRFLTCCPRLVYEHKFQDEQGMLTAYNDAKRASNASDRRSTSGGFLMHHPKAGAKRNRSLRESPRSQSCTLR